MAREEAEAQDAVKISTQKWRLKSRSGRVHTQGKTIQIETQAALLAGLAQAVKGALPQQAPIRLL